MTCVKLQLVLSENFLILQLQKLLYFQNKARYRAENTLADTFLNLLFRDGDINTKVCLHLNFSFSWRDVKTENTLKWLKSRAEFLQNVCKSQHLLETPVSPLNLLTSLNKTNSSKPYYEIWFSIETQTVDSELHPAFMLYCEHNFEEVCLTSHVKGVYEGKGEQKEQNKS